MAKSKAKANAGVLVPSDGANSLSAAQLQQVEQLMLSCGLPSDGVRNFVRAINGGLVDGYVMPTFLATQGQRRKWCLKAKKAIDALALVLMDADERPDQKSAGVILHKSAELNALDALHLQMLGIDERVLRALLPPPLARVYLSMSDSVLIALLRALSEECKRMAGPATRDKKPIRPRQRAANDLARSWFNCFDEPPTASGNDEAAHSPFLQTLAMIITLRENGRYIDPRAVRETARKAIASAKRARTYETAHAP